MPFDNIGSKRLPSRIAVGRPFRCPDAAGSARKRKAAPRRAALQSPTSSTVPQTKAGLSKRRTIDRRPQPAQCCHWRDRPQPYSRRVASSEASLARSPRGGLFRRYRARTERCRPVLTLAVSFAAHQQGAASGNWGGFFLSARIGGTTETKHCSAFAMNAWSELLRNPAFLRGRATERRREAEESTGLRQSFCERVATDLEQEALTIERGLAPPPP
jgi:hypothetical protein